MYYFCTNPVVNIITVPLLHVVSRLKEDVPFECQELKLLLRNVLL